MFAAVHLSLLSPASGDMKRLIVTSKHQLYLKNCLEMLNKINIEYGNVEQNKYIVRKTTLTESNLIKGTSNFFVTATYFIPLRKLFHAL